MSDVGGRGSSSGKSAVKNGGGIQYTRNGITFTLEQKNGVMYNVSDLADIPEKVGKGFSGAEIIERLNRTGTEFKVLSPADMQARRDARNADREARKNIDYELGAGVPWGNKANRQAARRGRLASRAAKRRR